MNIVTRALISRHPDPKMRDFVEHWDAIEALALRAYRAKGAGPADEKEYQKARKWLLANYSRWESPLAPYWQAATINGEPAQADPFRSTLAKGSATEFVGDWGAIQQLPAAREAINQYLMSFPE